MDSSEEVLQHEAQLAIQQQITITNWFIIPDYSVFSPLVSHSNVDWLRLNCLVDGVDAVKISSQPVVVKSSSINQNRHCTRYFLPLTGFT